MLRCLLLCLAANAAAAMSIGAASIGAESSRRMLLLHGSGTSAGTFVNSPTASGAKRYLAGVPRRADAGASIPPNWQYHALDAGTDDGSWWTGDDGKGLEKSVASVERALVEQAAVGIVGHEQGATLAAIVAARSALGEGPRIKFAVLCGAAMPPPPHAALLHRLRDDSAAGAVQTLHCISPTDSDSAAVAACFGQEAETLFHDGGGAMPGPGWWEETRGYPERVTGGRFWCTQVGPARYYATGNMVM